MRPTSCDCGHDHGVSEDTCDRCYWCTAVSRAQRSIEIACPWGNCSNSYDPLTREIWAGMGPVGCPCESLPGWRSPHPEGRPRPAVPAKPRGRHGSRVQRSRRRHRLPDMSGVEDWQWLPPT